MKRAVTFISVNCLVTLIACSSDEDAEGKQKAVEEAN